MWIILGAVLLVFALSRAGGFLLGVLFGIGVSIATVLLIGAPK